MIDITSIIKIAVELLAAVAMVFLIPYLKVKIPNEKRTELVKWVQIAVQAAEEAARSGLIDKSGKYNYALSVLEGRGITYNSPDIRALIDSTCWELFNQFKE